MTNGQSCTPLADMLSVLNLLPESVTAHMQLCADCDLLPIHLDCVTLESQKPRESGYIYNYDWIVGLTSLPLLTAEERFIHRKYSSYTDPCPSGWIRIEELTWDDARHEENPSIISEHQWYLLPLVTDVRSSTYLLIDLEGDVAKRRAYVIIGSAHAQRLMPYAKRRQVRLA
jgi:hypothetical protein